MIQGDSSAWRQRLIDVHGLLLTRIAVLWPRCVPRLTTGVREDSITDRLVLALQRDSLTGRRLIIVPQYKLLDESRYGDVVTKGFIDIAVFLHSNQRLYLAFECKRLNAPYSGRRRSLAGSYVDHGLMRYVAAQYARSLPLGAMLGYVMDGDIRWALERLAAATRSRAAKLGLDGALENLPSVDYLRCFRTCHRRHGELVFFEVRHTLLPLAPEAAF